MPRLSLASRSGPIPPSDANSPHPSSGPRDSIMRNRGRGTFRTSRSPLEWGALLYSCQNGSPAHTTPRHPDKGHSVKPRSELQYGVERGNALRSRRSVLALLLSAGPSGRRARCSSSVLLSRRPWVGSHGLASKASGQRRQLAPVIAVPGEYVPPSQQPVSSDTGLPVRLESIAWYETNGELVYWQLDLCPCLVPECGCGQVCASVRIRGRSRD